MTPALAPWNESETFSSPRKEQAPDGKTPSREGCAVRRPDARRTCLCQKNLRPGRDAPIRRMTAWKSPYLLIGGFLNNFARFFHQVIQLVHQHVDLSIGGFDLPLVQLFVVRDERRGELAVQG